MKVKDLIYRLLNYDSNAEVIFSYYIQDDSNKILTHGKFDENTNIIISYHDKIEIYNAYIRKV